MTRPVSRSLYPVPGLREPHWDRSALVIASVLDLPSPVLPIQAAERRVWVQRCLFDAVDIVEVALALVKPVHCEARPSRVPALLSPDPPR